MSTETDWRRIADKRLAMLNEIAQIGAEPPSAVLAIITGGEPDPDAGSTDTSTMYHHSLGELRAQLMGAADDWNRRKKGHFEEVYAERNKDEKPSVQLLDAYVGTMMAGSYAYTLAAILGLAEREFGPQTARRLASAADDILENGDFDDLNADVRPGAPLPPPSPAEQEGAGQIPLGALEPVEAGGYAA